MAAQPHEEYTIEVEHLVKRYPKAPVNAVDGISFAVRRGEIFGLLGPNGAGKTTTIGVLTTGVVPTSGVARLTGVDVAKDPISVKQRIAVLPQRSNLDGSLKVREILTFHAAYHGIPKAEREARADSTPRRARVGRPQERPRQPLLRWHESAADDRSRADALARRALPRRADQQPRPAVAPLPLGSHPRTNARGLTILITTHDMDEADRLCERIAVMDHGKILVDDTPDALKKMIPGGTSLELRVSAPELVPAGGSEHLATQNRVLDALRALPGVAKVDVVESTVAAPAGPPAGGSPWAGARGGNGAGGGAWGGGGGGLTSESADQEVVVLRVYAEDAAALLVPAAQAIAGTGVELRDLHLKRPSLEDVFIYLTGRHLR